MPDLLWNRRVELAPYFDAWEVASGKKIFEEVYASGLPMIANSDLHRPEQIESWKTRFTTGEDLITLKDISDGLRSQNVSFEYYKNGDFYDHGSRRPHVLGHRNSSVDHRLSARLA